MDKPHRVRDYALCFVPVLVFFCAFVFFTAQASGVPDNDYWYMAASFLGPDGIHVDIPGLLQKSNEHIVALAKLVYVANYYVTAGDNYGLSLIACVFSLAIGVLLLLPLLKESENWPALAAVCLIVPVFAFPTLAAHNYFLGMSGVAWIGANLFAVIAAVLFWHGNRSGWRSRLILPLAIAVAAPLFYSTGLAAVVALAVQALLVKRSRVAGIAIAIVGLLCILTVYWLQDVPGSHPPRDFDLWQIALFSVTFIGGAVRPASYSIVIGLVGLVAFARLAWLRLSRGAGVDFDAALWISIGAYAGLNALFAAIGRGHVGISAALAGRYDTVPALFWIGLLGLIVGTGELRTSPVLRRSALLVMLVLAGLSFVTGLPRFRDGLERAKGKQLATLALSLGVRDNTLVGRFVTPVAAQFYADEPFLRKAGHVPFDGRDFGCPKLGQRLAYSTATGALAGNIDTVEATDTDAWQRLTGWAAWEDRMQPPLVASQLLGRYRCLAFVDAAGMVVGLGLGGTDRPEVAQALGRHRDDYGWVGYVDRRRIGPQGGSAVYLAVPGSSDSGWFRLDKLIDLKQTG